MPDATRSRAVVQPALPGPLLAQARRAAGLTQADLALRLGTSQAAVAQLERPASNPRVETLRRALRGAGAELVMSVRPRQRSLDESLIRRQLELTAQQRLAGLEAAYEQARELAKAGAIARGELA
jgi:transcriptional regulator with XRE-family HTH domain